MCHYKINILGEIIMAKIDEKYRNAYNSAALILSTSVDFFRIFPKCFLEQIKSSNGHLYKILEGNGYMENMEPEVFEKLIEEELKTYIENVNTMEAKTNLIAEWEMYEDKLAFLQYVMDKDDLMQRLKGFNVDEFKEIDKLIKAKEISSEEAIKNFGIENEDLLEYEKNFETYGLA